MASSSKKKRAQGGGRTPNSEPRQQLFKEFGGCNFQLSPRDFTLGKTVDQEQSDLAMNYVVIQNNAEIAANKTIETRNNLQMLYTVPSEREYTGACLLTGRSLFVGLNDGSLKCYLIGVSTVFNVNITDNRDTATEHHWTSFERVDDKLICATQEGDLWIGDLDGGRLVMPSFVANAKKVADPPALAAANFTGVNNVQFRYSVSDDYPYRIGIAYAYVNQFGPTKHSDQFTIYANKPVDEWSGTDYLRITGTAPTGYGIKAVEIYYTTGNSSELLFCGRYDFTGGNGGNWTFDWTGYLDATHMWPVANLIAPTENYTEGVKASHVKCIDSRMYFWGDPNQPQRLYIGGNPGNLFSISPGTGGGFVDVEPGTGQEVRVVTKYKTQSGASIVTMLCDSKNSQKEQRYNLVENQVSLSNEQNMKSWQAEQVAGAVGCKSYDGAVVCEDGIYSISRYGLALTTMTMEYNSQIRTNYVSDAIKPVFLDQNGVVLKYSALVECDGIIYLAIGKSDTSIDNMVFCYDIDQKAWWTITLDIDEPILKLFHIDYESKQEGIGIITKNHIYMLPTTKLNAPSDSANFSTVIQTGELATQQPQQNWLYLSQMEFRFDYFIGSVLIELTGIDQFGRKVTTKKTISHDSAVYNLAEYMRVDLRLQSYQIRITGQARFRLTHFIAKVYTMSAKQCLVWGFDDSQSFRSSGDIHPTFLDYNDIRKAIIP